MLTLQALPAQAVCPVLLRLGNLHSLRLGEAVQWDCHLLGHTPAICLEVQVSGHAHCGAGGSAPAAVSLLRSPDEWLRLGGSPRYLVVPQCISIMVTLKY